jgi:hypothetical protein
MNYITITITDEDVLDLAEDLGIDNDTALLRAASWGKYIEETAQSLVNEQLASVIEHDQP